jgi:large subunit ribosomal protein L22
MASREKKKALDRKEAREAGGARARLRGYRMSSRKARVMADLIRGKTVESAIAILSFQQRKAALPIRKLLDSAVANAEGRNMDLDKLIVASVMVDKGPVMKRWLPRAHGRATPLKKQTSHVTVELVEAE